MRALYPVILILSILTFLGLAIFGNVNQVYGANITYSIDINVSISPSDQHNTLPNGVPINVSISPSDQHQPLQNSFPIDVTYYICENIQNICYLFSPVEPQEDYGGNGQPLPGLGFSVNEVSILQNDITLMLLSVGAAGLAFIIHPVFGLVSLVALALAGAFGDYGFLVVVGVVSFILYIIWSRLSSGGGGGVLEAPTE